MKSRMKHTPAKTLAKEFENWLCDDNYCWLLDNPELAEFVNGKSLKEILILMSLHCSDEKTIIEDK